MNPVSRAALAAVLAFLFVGCQDHHYIPIEKAGKLHIPNGTENAPGFSESPPEQKQVMAEAQKLGAAPQIPAPTPKDSPHGKGPVIDPSATIVDGALELGAEQKKMDFKGWTIYVLVRLVDRPAPPLAVTRLPVGKFPVSFVITNANLMAAEPAKPGDKIIIEARLDKDGDPITKDPGDVYGFALKPVPVGSHGANVVIDQVRR